MKKIATLLIISILIPQVAFAAKFQPELQSEIDRVSKIYTEDLTLDTNTFCGVTKERTDYFNGKESHMKTCAKFKARIESELQCLNNTKKMLKQNLLPRVSFSYFVDNKGDSCFTDAYSSSNSGTFGVRSEKASADMFKAISTYTKLN